MAKKIIYCSVEGCERRCHGQGFCDNHYRVWKRTGNPIPKLDYSLTPEQRFWANTQKSENCWLWAGSTDSSGYGLISIDGRNNKAHRFSFFLANGYWAKECVLHSCDNPPCVNPDHLREGNHKDNSNDKYERGRQNILRGADNGAAKLTELQVLEIRQLLQNGISQRKIANQFQVNQRVIWNILHRKSWAHI